MRVTRRNQGLLAPGPLQTNNLLLTIDESGYVTQNVSFTADFFRGLRSLAIRNRLALVTATRRELVHLCLPKEIKCSPTFNTLANVALCPLSRGDVSDLIETCVGGTKLAFKPEERGSAWALGEAVLASCRWLAIPFWRRSSRAFLPRLSGPS